MTDATDQAAQIISDADSGKPRGVTGKKGMREASEQRVRDIVAAAAEHFSEVGFAGSTREIAKRVGVTQPLLYRYFPTKADLIEAVYQTIYLERWNPSWDELLKDRCQTTRDRFFEFYRQYTEIVFEPVSLRLSYYAGLRDTEINQWYNHLIEELILKRLVREHRAELGQPDEAYVSPTELEPAWQIHGGLMHYGWRKYVLGLRVAPDVDRVISDNLDMYFALARKSGDQTAARIELDKTYDQN